MNSPVNIWRSHKNLNKYLGKQGKLLVWTKVYVAPSGFEHQAPYIAGIVQFEDKSKLSVQVVDSEEADLKPNQKVVVVIRKIGKPKPDEVIEYGTKVKPL